MNTPDLRCALVTGGGGDIGRAACLAFARKGYRVAVCDCDLDAAQATAVALRAAGGDAEAYGADIADGAQVQQLMAAIKTRFGRLDAAFNNAGCGSARVPLAQVCEADWERVIRTNLGGTFRCMKYEILAMLDQGGGCIVNNSSIYGVGGGLNAAYTASKHAVSGLTKSASIAYAERNIRINAVCPGLLDAGLGRRYLEQVDAGGREQIVAAYPAGRLGTAEDVAHAVVWLCSEEARYIHGESLAVDGGYGARG